MSALTLAGVQGLVHTLVPPSFLMYAATMALLDAMGELPYHEFGTIMPSALPAPTALRKACPWSGPAVAMKALGL